jgi:arylsulfatase A
MIPHRVLRGAGTAARSAVLLALGALAACAAGPRAARPADWRPPDARPNIVLVLADDLGWAELGSYGNRFNETPALDRLAREGVRFTAAYAAGPVCSPTRAALMTGQWPARVGIVDYLRPRDPRFLDPARHVALPAALRRLGYATALVGKWHLTGDYARRRGDPARQGYDEVVLSETRYVGQADYVHPYAFMPAVRARRPGEYLVDRMNQEAVDVIRRHHARAPDQPFFLELSHYAVHVDLVGRADLVAKYARKPGAGAGPEARRNNPHLAAQLESIDRGVGQITATLRELGLDRRTLVVFTSDNGGALRVTTNAPLRGGKATLYEGGIRVPLLVRGPGVARGLVTDAVASTPDLYATLLEVAGGRPDPARPLDGVSLVPVLRGRPAAARAPLFWHYPLNRALFPDRPSASAIRSGRLKLIDFFERDSVELYDLARDPGERHNLAAAEPARARQLRARLAAWRRALRTDTLPLPARR